MYFASVVTVLKTRRKLSGGSTSRNSVRDRDDQLAGDRSPQQWAVGFNHLIILGAEVSTR